MDTLERNRMVLAYARLVWRVARDLWHQRAYVHRLGTIEDAVQVGMLGLIAAIRLYDPEHPSRAKFITYATRSIRNRIMAEAIRTCGEIHITGIAARDVMHPERAVLKPHCRMAAERVLAMVRRPLKDWLPIEASRSEEATAELDAEDHEWIDKALARIRKFDAEVFRLRAGWNGPALSVKETAERLRCTKLQVRYAQERGRAKLAELLGAERN